MNHKRNKSGFTIVELLIVIVVISIIALIISNVAGSIKTRAENTATETAIRSLKDQLLAYKAATGNYPGNVTTGDCLSNSTAAVCGVNASNTCFSGSTIAVESGSGGVISTELSQIAKNVPEQGTQRFRCNAGSGTAGGIIPISISSNGAPPSGYMVIYYLRGNVPCLSLDIATQIQRQQAFDTTKCTIFI